MPSWGPVPGVSYLNGSGGSRAAGPDLEEAGAGGRRLPPLAGGATLIDDHGLPVKYAHEVGRLLALDHTALAGRQESKSGKRGHWSFCVAPACLPPRPAWPGSTPNEAIMLMSPCMVWSVTL